MISLKLRPFVQSFFDMQAPRQPHVLLYFFHVFVWIYIVFPEVFCTIVIFSLSGKYAVRFSLPRDVFPLPCDHVLCFFTSAYYVNIQSINHENNHNETRLVRQIKKLETILLQGNTVLHVGSTYNKISKHTPIQLRIQSIFQQSKEEYLVALPVRALEIVSLCFSRFPLHSKEKFIQVTSCFSFKKRFKYSIIITCDFVCCSTGRRSNDLLEHHKR